MPPLALQKEAERKKYLAEMQALLREKINDEAVVASVLQDVLERRERLAPQHQSQLDQQVRLAVARVESAGSAREMVREVLHSFAQHTP
ncbi:MAG: hypothetical protein MIN69_25180 [Methylorubrum extorquens]|jgi:hypothetical protein|uniref:hypothetical protein n=1 Tax=Methylorubrum extorquens TaxID=408 RepID=UPI002FEE62C1